MNKKHYRSLDEAMEVFNQFGFEFEEGEEFPEDIDNMVKLVAPLSDHLLCHVFVVDNPCEDMDDDEIWSFGFSCPIKEGYRVNKRFVKELKPLVEGKVDESVSVFVKKEKDNIGIVLTPLRKMDSLTDSLTYCMDIMMSDEILQYIDKIDENSHIIN